MIDKKTIDELSNLARIEIPDEDKDGLTKDLGSILDYVSKLKEVSTEELLSDKEHINVFREDTGPHESGIYTEDILEEAPMTKDGYFVVKQVIREKK